MRWLKRVLLGLLSLLLLLAALIAGVDIALNSEAGRIVAARQINKYAGSMVRISGLGGHFPADIKLARLDIMDGQGAWLTGAGLELRWSPLALLHGNLAVQALTAQSLAVARPPAYPAAARQKKGGGLSWPPLRIRLARLEITTLSLPASLAGADTKLHVAGAADIHNLQTAKLDLDAGTPDRQAEYRLSGALTPETIALALALQEPPGGLLGHLAGAGISQPLSAGITIDGPRDHAPLTGAVTWGPARLSLAGTLGLNFQSPSADVTLTVPDLTPVAALARQRLSGRLTVNLWATSPDAGKTASAALRAQADISQTPSGMKELLTGETRLNAQAKLADGVLAISKLTLDGPQFNAQASGQLSQKTIDLTLNAALPRLAALAPQLTGAIALNSHFYGDPDDLSAEAALTGNATAPDVPSGPFSFTLKAAHLPQTPRGSLTGDGTLAGSQLALAAAFARDAQGNLSLGLTRADWKSLRATAQLSLAAGAALPTGTAHFALASLSDLDLFTGTRLQGAVKGDFSYQTGRNFGLDVTAKNLIALSSLGAINGTLNAEGEPAALGVKLDASIARLMSYPARLSLAGTLNLPAASAHLANLTAQWRGIPARLLGPADIETRPGLTVHHLNLALGKGSVALDGTLSPGLNAQAAVKNFDLTMAKLALPSIDAAGLVNLTADITGTPKAPLGKLTVKASGLRYMSKATAGLPAIALSGTAALKGGSTDLDLTADAGAAGNVTARGTVPFSLAGPMNLALTARLNLQPLNPALAAQGVAATGTVNASAQLRGTPRTPSGQISLAARNLHATTGGAAVLPPAAINARADIAKQSAALNLTVKAGQDIDLTANGTAPLSMTGPLNLALAGRLDLRVLDPILSASGTLIRGIVTTRLQVTGTPRAPIPNGTLRLAQGSVADIPSGLNLTAINASLAAANRLITLQSLSATAGKGSLTGHGTIDAGAASMPVNFVLNAHNATLLSSDLITETLDTALTWRGALKGSSLLGGRIDILKANINIPKSLPPSVANLPIHNASAPPPPARPHPPAPPVNLALDVRAKNQIFIRGDGLFAELGGHIKVGGTLADPQPSGGFKLIRGNFSLAGKALEFTSGQIEFNGGGFIPALDLEATTTTSNNGTATLVVGGTAEKPQITLTSSPPLPSDEILAQLLFGQSSSSLSPFQAASLAAALAQIAGVGGGASPLDSVRNALGLDQLSIGSSSTGMPSVQAGRYVMPGVYVGASQAANGQGTTANVEINLYKGLKLQTSTGTDSSGQDGSSVGLSYQFNY